jgi:two-component system KDP operon response regulator KdpE
VATNPKVLVIDDDPQIHRFLRPSLSLAGYDVLSALNGASGLEMLSAQTPDVILLDLGLPDTDGKNVILQIRTISKVPIIVLSARDQEDEKISSLDLGANDYVNKPFGIGELTARIRTALRRSYCAPDESGIYLCGNLRVDTLKHLVTLDDKPIHLTPKEFEVLLLLVRHAGLVLTHGQILGRVWGPEHMRDTQYLRVLMGRLRQKIEGEVSEPKLIVNEPGIGYRIAWPQA